MMWDEDYISQENLADVLKRGFNRRMAAEIMKHFALQEDLEGFTSKRIKDFGPAPGYDLRSKSGKHGYQIFYHILPEENITKFISQLEKLKESYESSGKQITSEFLEGNQGLLFGIKYNMCGGFSWRSC